MESHDVMHGITAIECNSPTIVGFFVYRHLGLLGCNIVLMKRFLPLFILTGLLFGQDILNLKSGESYTGTFYGKVGEDIVFKVEGKTSTKKYSINDVNTIVTKNGELTYPFDVPISQPKYKYQGLSPVEKNVIGCAGTCLFTILLTSWLLILNIEEGFTG